ncbi:hypothetical protein B0H13DRAFT_2308285 [Mycena leptocephala]|nr:hypothetical protein B0H13DRAFT_2308285 [Mycena leptocephala]
MHAFTAKFLDVASMDSSTDYSRGQEIYFEKSRSFSTNMICVALRGKGDVLMGKITTVRYALRSILAAHPQLYEVREVITANKVTAARAGAFVLRYPTLVSVLHSFVYAYENLLALSLATHYTFDGSEKVGVTLSLSLCQGVPCHPEAFAVAGPQVRAEVKEKEEVEGSDEDMGFGLFNRAVVR